MVSVRRFFTAGAFGRVMQVLGVLGAFGSGSYALYLLMWFRPDGIDTLRTFVAYAYLTLFAVVIPSAELGMMQHRHLVRFARFLLSHVGRAFLYIFMGGLLLGQDVAGWILGAYMIALGVLNVVAACTTPHHSDAQAVSVA
ncbi:hypothetical protein DQ04_06831030 [Trypanosoma grayi]|uniref:hypothetical protein n=1 Tax=Trypanosoma grayi TaxID=71804 RepID=UPI0004F40F49|nr:hypothetical protein DQ04_06831030 [Trypanosoma grayi]KEG08601.1 hypothetical protein DQ04_06831030 [Trypanosoma grayi]